MIRDATPDDAPTDDDSARVRRNRARHRRTMIHRRSGESALDPAEIASQVPAVDTGEMNPPVSPSAAGDLACGQAGKIPAADRAQWFDQLLIRTRGRACDSPRCGESPRRSAVDARGRATRGARPWRREARRGARGRGSPQRPGAAHCASRQA
jgi:hypothetical protein